uniref:Uncharacterized protein n=1 Tax=Prolemur simus TaxID=1328070 RepID=A0A8C8Z408_PROSS
MLHQPPPPGAAVGQVLLTVEASIARRAGAGKGGHVVGARARAARAAKTLVHVASTAWARETREAGAREGAHAVLTQAAIEAGVCAGGRWSAHQPSLTQICLA